MIKRRIIELEGSNSILELATDEKGKILFVKREDIEKETSTIRGYGELLSKSDIRFSNLTMPKNKKGYKVMFQYEYSRNDINKSRLGLITIYGPDGSIYSQEHLLEYSSIITIERGHKIIRDAIPTIKTKANTDLSGIVGTNIASFNSLELTAKTTRNGKTRKKSRLL